MRTGETQWEHGTRAPSSAYRRWVRIDAADPYSYVRRILVTSAAGWHRLRSTQEIVSLPADDPAGPDTTDAVAERERVAASPPR
jgi:hypothetical protein